MTSLPAPRRFSGPASTSAVFDHGAHVIEWTPAGHAPVLWMSAHSAFDSSHAIRGGVPICFPWFGNGRTGAMTPSHGFARLSTWQLLALVESPTGVRVTYGLDCADLAGSPGRLHAELVADFGSDLVLEFTVTNRDSAVIEFEEALHTYLAVGDIRHTRVTGLDGVTYVDWAPAAPSESAVQAGDITFREETDRLYLSGADVVVEDPVLGRRITVSRTNAAGVVVWNPWATKAATLQDFGDDEWTGMLCIEGTNVLGHAVRLDPGSTHTMGYRLHVEPLA